MKFKTLIYDALSLFFTVYQFEAMYNCTFFFFSLSPPFLPIFCDCIFVILSWTRHSHVWELKLRQQCLSFYHLSYSRSRLSVTHMRKLYDFMQEEQSQAEGAAGW